MRQPSFTYYSGETKITIKYKQIPYDNRYYFVYWGKIQIGQIPMHLVETHGLSSFFLVPANDRLAKFISRVEKYNEYLDQDM